MSEYDDWDLERLREECACREIVVNAKDGVKTLAGRLRVSDKAVQKVQEANESVELETDRGVFEPSKTQKTKAVEDRGNFNMVKRAKFPWVPQFMKVLASPRGL